MRFDTVHSKAGLGKVYMGKFCQHRNLTVIFMPLRPRA